MFYREKGFSFTLHNYCPPPIDPFVYNIASSDKFVLNKSEELAANALRLCKSVGSPLYGIHAGYIGDASTDLEGNFKFEKYRTSYVT